MTQARHTLEVFLPIKFTIRGGRKTIIGALPQAPIRTRFDDSLAKAAARAFRWKRRLEDGTYATIDEIASTEKFNAAYVQRILKLSLLAPDVIEAILNGRSDLTVEGLAKPLPTSWIEQRRMLIGA